MSTEGNKALVRRLYEGGWNKGQEVEAYSEVCSQDIVQHASGVYAFTGLEPALQVVRALRSAFPDANITIEDMVGEGDKLALYFTLRGTHQGEYLGIPATGKQIVFQDIAIFRFADGKVAEFWSVMDPMAIPRQLGADRLPGQE